MIAYKNKESRVIQKEFEQQKKETRDKINKKSKLTEDEVYNWLVQNSLTTNINNFQNKIQKIRKSLKTQDLKKYQ